jgi:hypothetical protein
MRLLSPAILAAFLVCAPLAARAAQNSPQRQAKVQPLTPPDTSGMQTLGKVGETNYLWTNGRAWMALSDNAKIALVAGIEQGVILGVRENWDSLPKKDRQDLVNTAARLTVGRFTFTQLAVRIDALYLQRANLGIPIVDAYEYAVLELKKTPKGQLKDFLDQLRKTYHLPKAPEVKKH